MKQSLGRRLFAHPGGLVARMAAGVPENRRRRAFRAITIGLGIAVALSAVTYLAVHGLDARAPVAGTGDGVPFERIDTNAELRPSPGIRVIQDEANWSAFWYGYMAPLPPPRPAPPAVNFTQYTVIVLSQGTRHTPGYSLAITSVHHEGSGLLVEAQETDGCSFAQIVIWLYDIVRVPKTTGPVDVLLHWNSAPCL